MENTDPHSALHDAIDRFYREGKPLIPRKEYDVFENEKDEVTKVFRSAIRGEIDIKDAVKTINEHTEKIRTLVLRLKLA